MPAKYRPVHTGNPVRVEITRLPEPAERLAQRRGALRVLVIGGSLGAHALNTTVPAALARLSPGNSCSVRHQTGAADVDAVRQAYARNNFV